MGELLEMDSHRGPIPDDTDTASDDAVAFSDLTRGMTVVSRLDVTPDLQKLPCLGRGLAERTEDRDLLEDRCSRVES
jgi:hypothetical protein